VVVSKFAEYDASRPSPATAGPVAGCPAPFPSRRNPPHPTRTNPDRLRRPTREDLGFQNCLRGARPRWHPLLPKPLLASRPGGEPAGSPTSWVGSRSVYQLRLRLVNHRRSP
jgi:hypothetical protein